MATGLFYGPFTDLLLSSILESDTKASCVPEKEEEETHAEAPTYTHPRNQG